MSPYALDYAMFSYSSLSGDGVVAHSGSSEVAESSAPLSNSTSTFVASFTVISSELQACETRFSSRYRNL